MKRTLLSLAVSSFLFTAPAFANDCIDNIAMHYWESIEIPSGKVVGGELSLVACNLHTSNIPDIVAFLKKHPEADQIDLGYNQIDNQGAIMLSQINNPISTLYIEENRIDDDGLAAIAHMPALQILYAASNHITDKGAKAIISNTTLKSVNLQDNQITPEGAKLLNTLPTLEDIGLGNNQLLGDETAILFAQNPHLVGVDLEDSQVTDVGALALAANSNLREIELGSTNITSVGAKAIASKPNLEYVALDYDRIGSETVTAIAKNPSIEAADLSGNKLFDNDAQILKNSATYELFLDDNNIGPIGAGALASTHLFYLALNNNPLGDNGAVALSKSTNIKALAIANTGIGAKGAASLGKMPFWDLNADNNNFGDDGVAAFANSLSIAGENPDLSLANNQIGDMGAIALSKLGKESYIPYLNVSYNHITSVGLGALSSSPAIGWLVADGNDNKAKAKLSAKEQHKVSARMLVKIATTKHYCAGKKDSYCAKLAEHHFINSSFFRKG